MKDKQKQKEASRKHYLANKEKVKERAALFSKEAVRRNREYVQSYSLNNPCVDCGEADPIVLEFDHVKGKKKGNIADMIYHACSIKTIQKEIDKCEVRCANCHRRVTYFRRLDIGI